MCPQMYRCPGIVLYCVDVVGFIAMGDITEEDELKKSWIVNSKDK